MPTTTVQTKPRFPSLAEVMRQHGKLGLAAVFQTYDQQVLKYNDQREMAERFQAAPLPVSSGRLKTAAERAAASSSGGPLPNAGWAYYDYEARIGDGSTRVRPLSTGIAIEITQFKVDWFETGFVRAWTPSGGGFFDWDSYMLSTNGQNIVAPRTFAIIFNETPTAEGYHPAGGRLHCRVSLIPGGAITTGGTTYPAVTEAVRTVTKRIAAGQYVAWLESAETDNPTPVDRLHVGAILVEAV